MPQPKLIFSTTESGDSWERCQQSWWWGSLNGMGLEAALPSKALSLGSLIHYTMADWGALYATHQWKEFPGLDLLIGSTTEPDPVAIFNRHYEAFKASTFSRYESFIGAPMEESEWQVYEDEVGEMGEAMVANYLKRWGYPYPEDCTLLAPEQTIVIAVPKVKRRQRQLYLEGTLDQLLQIDNTGELLIRDFKTYEKVPSIYELDANDQFMTYHGMVAQTWTEYKVAGVIYDGMWKRKGITSTMRKGELDLQKREYLLYGEEKIANHMAIVPWRLERMATALRERRRLGPVVLDKRRSWSSCPGCSFADPCTQLLDGDFGEWDDDAEVDALVDYQPRQRGAAWRVPLPELAKAA